MTDHGLATKYRSYLVPTDGAGMTLDDVININHLRVNDLLSPYNPMTGFHAYGRRMKVFIAGFPIEYQWLPYEMREVPLVKSLVKYGLDVTTERIAGGFSPEARDMVLDQFMRIRFLYDFDFWCWMEVKIHPKGSGDDIPFRLNRAQRRLIARFEDMRRKGKPIRLILLKARQWGGSTATQVYIAWLQLVHMIGAHSIIVGHEKTVSAEVYDMYTKLLDNYPSVLLYKPGEVFNDRLPKIHGNSRTPNIYYVDSRKCKIKIGTAERPDTARGGDSTLAHCTEVALWKATEGKTPEDIIEAVTGGINYEPNTMIVYESTAKGSGNFFHTEYTAAKKAETDHTFYEFERLFVNWHEIGWKNTLLFRDDERLLRSKHIPDGMSVQQALMTDPDFDFYMKDSIMPEAPTEREFAEQIFNFRNQVTAPDERHEPGNYLWRLFRDGATLEGIYWYVINRTRFTDHADWAAETPSDDIEAFKFSGEIVFAQHYVEALRGGCRPPRYVGEVECNLEVSAEDFKRYRYRANEAFNGKNLLKNLSFRPDPQGNLSVWELPEHFTDCTVKNRYIVSVDIGGMSNKADWSVIMVLDRYWMMEGGKPQVVAQWVGHIDHDVLAWKSAQIAAFYDNALLVIESNTLETRDKERDTDGDMSGFILNQIKESYDNLYERTADEEAILSGAPRRFGFHTNNRTKPMIIMHLVKCLREGSYIERDSGTLEEYLVYEKKPNSDSYGARAKYHDDRLMTRALSLFICFCEMPMPMIIENKKKEISYTRENEVSAATF